MASFINNRPCWDEGAQPLPDQSGSHFANEHLCLFEWLTEPTWADGSPRMTSSVTLFVHQGAWKACFSDRDGQRIAFVTGPTLEALLETLDRSLQDDSLDWKVSTPNPKRGTKKA